jgi:hypothetical protein
MVCLVNPERQGDLLAARKLEVVSPELALIDPALAARARGSLRTHDTLASIASRARLRYPTPSVDRHEDVARPARPRFANRRLRVATAASVACLATTAFLVGVRIEFDGSPAGAESVPAASPQSSAQTASPSSANPTSPATTKPPGRSKPSQASPTGRTAAPQRFAWAPVPRASGYHVELFRAGEQILEADTVDPQIVIRPTWKLGLTTQRLRPGEYRWYVWPRVDGRLSSTAIVQARLVVPAG